MTRTDALIFSLAEFALAGRTAEILRFAQDENMKARLLPS
jgi:hypothetical protein